MLPGAVYGRLTVLGEGPRGERLRYNKRWWCRCSCGKETLVWQNGLKNGHTRSCGCLHTDTARTHGHSRAADYIPEYGVWLRMLSRCRNHRVPNWRLYGGRGITVCERWLCFSNFLADMGRRPPGMTLDRINNNGNYEPGNCRWADWKTQNQNQRRRRLVTVGDSSLCLTEWSRRIGVPFHTMWYRATHGWSDEEIVNGRGHA